MATRKKKPARPAKRPRSNSRHTGRKNRAACARERRGTRSNSGSHGGTASPVRVVVIYLKREPLNSGGYTSSGRYFGRGAPLYHYYDDDGDIDGYARGSDREDAKDEVTDALRSKYLMPVGKVTNHHFSPFRFAR